MQFLEVVGLRFGFLAGCQLGVALSPTDLSFSTICPLHLQANKCASNPSCWIWVPLFQPTGENSWLCQTRPCYHITYLKVNCAIYQSNHGSKIHHIHSPKGHAGHVHERDGQSRWTILEFCLPQGRAPNCLSSRSHKTLIYFCLILLSLEVPIWTTWTASDWSWVFNLFFSDSVTQKFIMTSPAIACPESQNGVGHARLWGSPLFSVNGPWFLFLSNCSPTSTLCGSEKSPISALRMSRCCLFGHFKTPSPLGLSVWRPKLTQERLVQAARKELCSFIPWGYEQ